MGTDVQKPAEERLYEPVKEYLSRRLTTYPSNYYHLEITAHGTFSEQLKRVVQDDIVFSFLKRDRPDLTGFILRKNIDKNLATSRHVRSLITVEVKPDKVALQDIYQASRYGDLFHAEYALLISLEPLQEEIKRLHKQLSLLNRFQGLQVARKRLKKGKPIRWRVDSWKVYFGQAFLMNSSDSRLEIQDIIWFPRNPF